MAKDEAAKVDAKASVAAPVTRRSHRWAGAERPRGTARAGEAVSRRVRLHRRDPPWGYEIDGSTIRWT